MFKAELEELEGIARTILNYKEMKGEALSVSQASGDMDRLAQTCYKLKENWLRALFSNVKDPIIQRAVRYHQIVITALSDAFVTNKGQLLASPVIHLRTSADRAIFLLEDLLAFFERRFCHFFDYEYRLSIHQREVQLAEVHKRLSLITAKLRLMIGRSELADAFLTSFRSKLLNDGSVGTNHRQIGYQSGLLKVIDEWLNGVEVNEIQFHKLLYLHNFNSAEFELWSRKHFLFAVNSVKKKDRDLVLDQLITGLTSVPEDADYCFDKKRMSIDKTLRKWLLEYKATLLPPFTTSSATTDRNGRLSLNLSVPQLAFFTRLCYLEGCLHVSNISFVIRFFTAHFATKKQFNISLKSFARAFYAVDQQTAATIRDVLQRMIARINKLYFPRT